MPLWYFIFHHPPYWPLRAALASPVTSSPRGLTSSTTRGATTVTTTWRGASCLRTSKPGNRKKNKPSPTTLWWNAADVRIELCYLVSPSLAADSYEWGSQSSGISAYIGGDDGYSLPPPSEELSHYWPDWLLLSCGIFFFLSVCLHCHRLGTWGQLAAPDSITRFGQR